MNAEPMTADPFQLNPDPRPKRIQRQRTKGWRMPEGAIYVGRPSRWANIYRVGRGYPAWQCVALFSRDLLQLIADCRIDPTYLGALRGHDLACWCPLDQPCHADVLLELANR